MIHAAIERLPAGRHPRRDDDVGVDRRDVRRAARRVGARARRRRPGHRRRRPRRRRSHGDGFSGLVEGRSARRAPSRRRPARSTSRSSAPAPIVQPGRRHRRRCGRRGAWSRGRTRPRWPGSARDRVAKEEKTRERLRNGELGLDFYGLRAKLAELGVQYVDERVARARAEARQTQRRLTMGEIVAAVGTCHTPYMFTRPPDENPEQLDQAGARRCTSSARCSTRPSRTSSCSSAPITSRRFRSPACRPSAIVAGSTRHRAVRRPRAQPADPSRDGRRHPEQAGRRTQLRHRVLGRRRARPRVRHAVRIRHRQARHPGHSVLHQRLRAAAADAAALRGARQGDRRDRQGTQGARRDHRQRRHVALPRHDEVSASRNSTSIAGWCRSSRRATPMRC